MLLYIMSGQPYKNQLDMATARNSYLANLKLRAELDDKNLQANKVYIKTGQLPQEQTDQRNVSEKLADVERLKIDLRSKLLAITDGFEAGKIVNGLTPDQLVFLAQQFEPIKDQMKKSYSLGVLAPIFIEYLTKFIDKFQITKGVEMGLQQTSANQMIANQNLILANMADKDNIDDLMIRIRNLGIENSRLGTSISEKLVELKDIVEYIADNTDIIRRSDNPILLRQVLKTVNDITNELPSKQDLIEVLVQLEKNSIVRDRRALGLTLEKLDQILTIGGDISEEMEILKTFVNQIKAGNPIDTQEFIPEANVKEARVYNQDQQAIQNIYRRSDHPTLDTNQKLKDYITQRYPIIQEDERKSRNQFVSDTVGRDFTALNKNELIQVVQALNDRLRLKGWGEPNPPGVGRGIFGCGVVKRVRPSQVLSTDVDYSMGVSESPKFIPIGRYLINKRQLDKDIIAIKRKGGSVINTLPSQRVSRKLGNVIRKVVGGSIPSYEDFNELSNDDKIFLNKVAKETRIDDKLSIPAPKKSDEDKDINQFEILRGQILAGNDNPDVVKKFKSIILKLSNNNLIPKNQVRDLLLDLATLGH